MVSYFTPHHFEALTIKLTGPKGPKDKIMAYVNPKTGKVECDGFMRDEPAPSDTSSASCWKDDQHRLAIIDECICAVRSCELVSPNARRIRLDEAIGALCELKENSNDPASPDRNQQKEKTMIEGENDNDKAGVSGTRACTGSVSFEFCEFEKSGYCDHANPKICDHALKIHKTNKHEPRRWICEKAL